jgi:hypothetical protein
MSVESVPPDQWESGEYRPLAALSVPIADLAAKLRLRTTEFESDGLGPTVQARCRLGDGTQFILNEFLSGPKRPSTEIWCCWEPSGGRALLTTIVGSLGVRSISVSWTHPQA